MSILTSNFSRLSMKHFYNITTHIEKKICTLKVVCLYYLFNCAVWKKVHNHLNLFKIMWAKVCCTKKVITNIKICHFNIVQYDDGTTVSMTMLLNQTSPRIFSCPVERLVCYDILPIFSTEIFNIDISRSKFNPL